VLGFNARRAHRIVPLAECHVLRPAIVGLLPALRALVATLPPLPSGFDVHVADLDGGLDVWLKADLDLRLAVRERLAGFAAETGIARLAVGAAPPEVVVQARTPRVLPADDIAVAPPPGGFLQASAEAEAFLRARVAAAAEGARRVVDLYAGCGLLSLPLARRAALALYEVDAGAVAAARATGLGLTAEARDLAKRPLQPDELARVDLAVLDPPRAGAAAQAAALARSRVPRVVYVSCHPGSFARDARTLADGGYRLAGVIPVDQFRWSAHIELVGVFER
jgi:23S rRNA (uracil1939-C5)-methyltransferase